MRLALRIVTSGVALGAVASGVVALWPTDGARSVAASRRCGPGYAASIRAWDRTRDASYAAAPGERVVAFLGDSYTQGVLLHSLDQDYGVVAARALGWRPWLAGRGGTGYVNGGPCGGGASYAVRVPDALAQHPQVVVVEGSINDWRTAPATIAAAARHVWSEIRTAAPGARVVALGPCRVPKIPDDRVDGIDAALRAAADTAGVAYVSERDWIDAPGLVVPDGMHPTVAGHAVIGARLARALRSAVG